MVKRQTKKALLIETKKKLRKDKALLIWKSIGHHSSLADRNEALKLVVQHVKNQDIGTVDLVESLTKNVLRPIVFASGGRGVFDTATTKALIRDHIREYGKGGGEPLAEDGEDLTEEVDDLEVVDVTEQAVIDVDAQAIMEVDAQAIMEVDGPAVVHVEDQVVMEVDDQAVMQVEDQVEIVAVDRTVVDAERSGSVEDEGATSTRADLDDYFGRVRDHLRKWTLSSLLDQIEGAATLQASSLSESITLLQDILQWCQEGRLAHAIEVARLWWVPVDVMTILERGLYLYIHRLNVGSDRRSLICHEMASLMSIEMHKRYAPQEIYSLEALHEEERELQDDARNGVVVGVDKSIDPVWDVNYRDQIWTEGFYDPVNANGWFFAMGVPFRLTDKLSVYKTNINRRNRKGHLAYLICYHNSYQMRRLMMKSEDGDEDDHAEPQHVFDDDNQEMKIEVAESWSILKSILPVEATKPHCFEQSDRGACLTLAFLNFLVNSSGLDADRSLYQAMKITRKELREFAVEGSSDLHRIHHRFLSPHASMAFGATTIREEANKQEAIKEDISHTAGNHIVIIIPFSGHVFELDGLGASRIIYLGRAGQDWTAVAQQRLEQWSKAACITRVHNDVHAIVMDD